MQSPENTLFHAPELDQILEVFAREETKTITPELERILDQISKTGITCYSWTNTKMLIAVRLSQIFTEFKMQESPQLSSRCQAFLNAVDSFREPPFTLQRLIELVLKPQMYRARDKYLFALEKLVSVSTTMLQLSPDAYNNQVKELLQQRLEVEERGKEDLKGTSSSYNNVSAMEEEKITPMDVESTGPL